MGPSQLQYKKGHITNIYLTDADEEAIADFVKDKQTDLHALNNFSC